MYSAGDKVTIRSDLIYQRRYDGTYINRNKWLHRGRELEIQGSFFDHSKGKFVYYTHYPYEYWTEGCFEKQEPLPEIELTVEEWMEIL